MTPEQFTYWLQGYAELNATPPTVEQWQCIKDHLALLFKKETPALSPPTHIFTVPKSPFAGEVTAFPGQMTTIC